MAIENRKSSQPSTDRPKYLRSILMKQSMLEIKSNPINSVHVPKDSFMIDREPQTFNIPLFSLSIAKKSRSKREKLDFSDKQINKIRKSIPSKKNIRESKDNLVLPNFDQDIMNNLKVMSFGLFQIPHSNISCDNHSNQTFQLSRVGSRRNDRPAYSSYLKMRASSSSNALLRLDFAETTYQRDISMKDDPTSTFRDGCEGDNVNEFIKANTSVSSHKNAGFMNGKISANALAAISESLRTFNTATETRTFINPSKLKEKKFNKQKGLSYSKSAAVLGIKASSSFAAPPNSRKSKERKIIPANQTTSRRDHSIRHSNKPPLQLDKIYERFGLRPITNKKRPSFRFN